MCTVMPVEAIVRVHEGSCTLVVSNETLCLKGYSFSQENCSNDINLIHIDFVMKRLLISFGQVGRH